MMKRRLYRSRQDRMITGLAGGLGEYFGIDSTLIRAALVILEFLTAGLLIIGYLIVALIVPKEPLPSEGRKKV